MLKGIYESEYTNSTGVEFIKWLGVNTPLMLAIMYPTWLWMQFWFMGLWRPNSADAIATNVGKEGERIIRHVLSNKLEDLGPCSLHEILVGILFILVVLLWFLRKPEFIPGWADLITTTKVRISIY